jgi:hypothetical protein
MRLMLTYSTKSSSILHLISLTLPEHITVLLQRAADQLRLLPEVRCEEAVGVDDGGEGGLESVLKRLCGTG